MVIKQHYTLTQLYNRSSTVHHRQLYMEYISNIVVKNMAVQHISNITEGLPVKCRSVGQASFNTAWFTDKNGYLVEQKMLNCDWYKLFIKVSNSLQRK